MRLVIQRKDDGIYVGNEMEPLRKIKQGVAEKIDEEEIFEMATAILVLFPRFNEVIVSTKLTYNVQEDNSKTDDTQR